MARTATQAVPKRTLFISYDPRSKKAIQFLSALKVLDFLTIEESPYDPSFVAKINKAEKSSKRIVDVSKIWD